MALILSQMLNWYDRHQFIYIIIAIGVVPVVIGELHCSFNSAQQLMPSIIKHAQLLSNRLHATAWRHLVFPVLHIGLLILGLVLLRRQHHMKGSWSPNNEFSEVLAPPASPLPTQLITSFENGLVSRTSFQSSTEEEA